MALADFAVGLQVGLSVCEQSLLATMEDVVFVSERAVGKRKRQDEDDDAERKRLQVKDEDSSDDESSSSSSSDDDRDDEPNGMVENAMSAIPITTEPRAMWSQNNLTVRIKSEGSSGSKQDQGDSARKRKYEYTHELELTSTDIVLTYLDELEDALRARFPNATFTKREKVCRNTDALHGYVASLEKVARFALTNDDPVRRATVNNICSGAKKRRWTKEVLNLRLACLRMPYGGIAASRPTAVTGHSSQNDSKGLRTASADVHAMRDEIAALKEEVRREKRTAQEAARNARIAKNKNTIHEQQIARKQGEFDRTTKERDKLVEDWKKSTRDLELVLRRREAEIATLRSKRTGSTGTAESQEDSRRSKKAEKATKEASKAAKAAEEALKAAKVAEEALDKSRARTDAMFEHYDSVQNKNTVLIGKMRMMAKAGGFDGPNTAFRKDSDALKAPELTDLDEYQEQE